MDSEIEQLLKWLKEYEEDDPIIVAAWAHHRFTQIHPYQDGNGRVARALTTLLLLKADILPLVIERDMRVEYLDALEGADFESDLTKLATLFARLERNAILQALSVDSTTESKHGRSLTDAVIETLADKLAKRREQKYTELRTVNTLASGLRAHVRRQLERSLTSLREPVSAIAVPNIHISEGGRQRCTTRGATR